MRLILDPESGSSILLIICEDNVPDSPRKDSIQTTGLDFSWHRGDRMKPLYTSPVHGDSPGGRTVTASVSWSSQALPTPIRSWPGILRRLQPWDLRWESLFPHLVPWQTREATLPLNMVSTDSYTMGPDTDVQVLTFNQSETSTETSNQSQPGSRNRSHSGST